MSGLAISKRWRAALAAVGDRDGRRAAPVRAGQAALFRLFQRLREDDVRLLAAGDGRPQASLYAMM